MESNHSLEDCNIFDDNWPQWRKDLYNNGWAIVKNAITRERAEQYRQRFWDWVEVHRPGAKRNDPKSWSQHTLGADMFHGIIHGNIAHEQFMWDIRCEPAVLDIFKQIYNTEKLLASFDGGNISRPLRESEMGRSWAHFDQGHDKFGFRCIQGLMNLEECGPHDGGLIVLQDSHKLHDTYFQTTKETSSKDWYKFQGDPREIPLFSKCQKIKVCCDPGDFVLWDSRTIHWACAPTKNKGANRCRMVTYVSMQPASLATTATIAAKQDAFYGKFNTSHWAAESINVFGGIKQVNNVVLNPTIEKLAGLEYYDE
ncbi:hypothetical protein CYY_004818 [Polysphondylium violaceum]|uniref:Phytanoyl-CoA dioxygenase n=1 Tax=Polysphondylium violaceum TaxID=133409 RepID=A0A8J4V029_9MYCE|nr:hypothetical protein CYY_004818 [Polysphondylium violaceum]